LKAKNPEDIDAVRFYKHAMRFAGPRIPNKEDAEDFRGYAIQCWIKYGGKGNIEFIYKDWLRKQHGRGASKKMRDFEVQVGKLISNYGEDAAEYYDFSHFYRNLPLADTIIINLMTKWDFTGEEIAGVFGVSPALICQIKKEIRKRIEVLKR
jgi:hypothetical protein